MPRVSEFDPRSNAQVERDDKAANGKSIDKFMGGAVVGRFVIVDDVNSGEHPPEAKAAWKGISLPIRSREADTFKNLSDDNRNLQIGIRTYDAFNSLVNLIPEDLRENNAALNYWVNYLNSAPGNGNGTFYFDIGENDRGSPLKNPNLGVFSVNFPFCFVRARLHKTL